MVVVQDLADSVKGRPAVVLRNQQHQGSSNSMDPHVDAWLGALQVSGRGDHSRAEYCPSDPHIVAVGEEEVELEVVGQESEEVVVGLLIYLLGEGR